MRDLGIRPPVRARPRAAGFVSAALALCLLGSCAPRPAAGPPEAPPAGADSYFSLADATVHRLADGPPRGFHVWGRVDGDRFVPQGEIRGEGELAAGGHPGWMELADGSFHGNETGRAPFRPYVEGALGEDGVFRPASRAVVY